jgi:hypothetical protein
MPGFKLSPMVPFERLAVPLLLVLIVATLQGAAIQCELSCLAQSPHGPAQSVPAPVCDRDHSRNASGEAGSRQRPGPPSRSGKCDGHFHANGIMALATGKSPAPERIAAGGITLSASAVVFREDVSGHPPLAGAAASLSPPHLRSFAVLRI